MAKGQSIDTKSLLDFAGIATKTIGKVIIKLIEHQEHCSLLEYKLLDSSREPIFPPYGYNQSPIVTYPMDREALSWSPSRDPTELSNACSTIEIKETDSLLQEKETN